MDLFLESDVSKPAFKFDSAAADFLPRAGFVLGSFGRRTRLKKSSQSMIALQAPLRWGSFSTS
jgi:hypothetical protein